MFLKCLWIGEPISAPSTFLTVFLWSVFVLVCVLSQMKKLQKRERTCRAYMKVYLCYATMLLTCFCTFSSSFPAIVSQHGPMSFHSHCCHSISFRLCPHYRRFNISVDWKLCGCNFYASSYLLCVCWWSVYLYFFVSLLLKSFVNICWCVLELQVGRACSYWLQRVDANLWCLKCIDCYIGFFQSISNC